MANWQFYLPPAYFFGTRVTSWSARLSWALIYIAPLFLTLFAFAPDVVWSGYLYLSIGMLAIYAVYEIGYIENDVHTVKQEEQPTLRLDSNQTTYVEGKWRSIVLVRALITLALLMACSSADGFLWFLLGLALLLPTFMTYNRFRGPMNAWIHPWLVGIRFCAPLVLVLPQLDVLLYGFLLFPLINSLERAAEPRYGFLGLQSLWLTNQVSGRWSYYGMLLLTLGVWSWLNQQAWLMLLPVVYMFVYRVFTGLVRPVKARS